MKKLDVVANDIFVNSLSTCGKVYSMVSEENEKVILIKDGYLRGKYLVVFDPLDGSSNIDTGISVGTIFGIYILPEEKVSEDYNEQVAKECFERKGSEMIAAGYALYGSFTILVLTTGSGVNGYSLDPNLGEFILTNPNIRIPSKGRTYSINEGNSKYWREPIRKFIDSVIVQ